MPPFTFTRPVSDAAPASATRPAPSFVKVPEVTAAKAFDVPAAAVTVTGRAPKLPATV